MEKAISARRRARSRRAKSSVGDRTSRLSGAARTRGRDTRKELNA